MAFWLLLATLVLVYPGSLGNAGDDSSGRPRITHCRSAQLETFTCYWTYGSFHNLSKILQLQYKISDQPWMDCPDVVSGGENSCYFSQEHTSVLWNYVIRLVNDNVTLSADAFTLKEIVEPDPPVNLSWSILEANTSLLHRDIQIIWNPPPSGQEKPMEYEVQIKGANETQWDVVEVVDRTQLSLQDLHIGTEYLVRVRSRLTDIEKFGEFSNALSILPVNSEVKPTTLDPWKQQSSTVATTRGPIQKIIKKTYPPGWPTITDCRSPQQETFTCYWTYGDFHNLTGLLKLQYKQDQYRRPMNWTDCPDTTSAGENSCYFSKNYTAVWVGYKVRLIGGNVTFDEYIFMVDDIVRPDPPVALNWTALNVSETRLHMDIRLTWEHPATADVKSGWLSLEYEVQIKVANEMDWKPYELVTATELPMYGLKTWKEYHVRIHCRRKGNDKFGEFSEVLVIHPSVSMYVDVPWALFLISGLFAVAVSLAVLISCKKKRLKMLILPPVPVPKIKGIDPILLQNGKLDEVSSILANHDSYKQQLCIDDPWVEFIELDLDEQDEKNEGTDTDRLLGEEYPKAHSCLGVKDDDSGRASCCEPDIPETDFSSGDPCDATSDPAQPQNTKDNQADLLCLNEKSNTGGVSSDSQMPNTENLSTNPEEAKLCPLVANGKNVPASTQPNSLGSKPSTDFYALVSDITPAGRLLLSPGQRLKMENEECSEPAATQRPAALNMDNSYICESAVVAFCPVNFPTVASQMAPQSPNMDSYFTPESLTAAAMSSRASEKASSYEAPVADYTSVHIINSPQNLVLNTTAPPGKAFSPPCGYMSTDQVNKVMP
ncbi:growth hormone receptor isoform X2 [Hyperolius riggenbachi]|uniref:growth hormone receptor isoform X2 n=1 Tax=Hyperolius riggenbachi TaxID=752182 RepID=UPI0035A2E51A